MRKDGVWGWGMGEFEKYSLKGKIDPKKQAWNRGEEVYTKHI
jgi:hypothetical protein